VFPQYLEEQFPQSEDIDEKKARRLLRTLQERKLEIYLLRDLADQLDLGGWKEL